ncbi:spermidine/putrescine ABC transporter substrate-binding protein [Rhizobium sp. BK068]|uniref:polyamine ABC transporter substrate-binding protein n=1 Tax=Rhizobium sp. BK068 TaxID=2512130 RepID=UPI0010DCC1E5|nr:spermidine/putrescine ABC transporter substrate-binding protein [Rhizobium sp. BK068]TCM65743.1 spermidine/putrescine transport system substrate-binding protein [Rhizobium sp. BK068]
MLGIAKRIAFTATGVFAVSLGTAQAAETITFVTFSGYYPPKLFEEFEASTGIHVDLVEVATNEETMGKMMASKGAGFDAMVVSSPFVTALQKLDMLAEIDQKNIPNMSNLYPEAFKLAFDPGLKYSVPYAWGTFGICYRDDMLTQKPTSWMDILKPSDELKGKYTLVPDERWFMEPAQLVSGLSINDVSEKSLETIRPLLIETKKNVLAFDNFTMGSRLVSGEIAAAATWEAWCSMAMRDGGGDNIKYVVPKEGTDTFVDGFVIPKKSEHKEAAEKFINFVLQPEHHGWMTSELLYKIPNKAAMDKADPELIKKYSPLQITAEQLLKNEILADLGPDAPRVSKFVTEIMSQQ